MFWIYSWNVDPSPLGAPVDPSPLGAPKGGGNMFCPLEI